MQEDQSKNMVSLLKLSLQCNTLSITNFELGKCCISEKKVEHSELNPN